MSPSSTSSSRDGDGLFPVAAAPSRRAAWGVVGGFLFVLAATGLVEAFFPVPAPKLIGAEQRQEELLRSTARLGDGTRARLVEHDLRLRSRVRRTLGSYYALALFHFLGEAQGHVMVGRDGWLFLPGRTRLPERDDGAVVETSAALVAAVERRLASFGVRLVFAPVPRKSSLYRDYLPRGVDSRGELDEELVAALERRGVTTVDLPGVFRRHRERHPEALLYYQSDSHWTDTAQVLAAEEICRVAGLLAPPGERLGRVVSLGPARQERDHLEYLGLHLPARVLDVLDLPPVVRVGVERDGAIVTSHHNPPAMAAVAVSGTSFTARRKLPLLLEHFAGRPVWNAADPGAYPLETVSRLLVDAAASLPETLVLEMPAHYVIGRQPLPGIELLFAQPPPTDVPARVVRALTPLPRAPAAGGRIDVAWSREGRLVHSGDGVAAVRVRGRTRGGPGRLWLVHGDRIVRAPWPEDRREALLPLVAAAPSGKAIVLRGSANFELESAHVEAVAVAGGGAVAARSARVEARDGGGWRQRLVFPDRPTVTRHAALLLRLDAKGAALGGRARLTVRAEGGARLELELAPVRARGVVLVGLGPLRDRRLLRAEIAGDGEAPREVVRSALFLPPAFSNARATSPAIGRR